MPSRRKPIYADVPSSQQERKLTQHLEELIVAPRLQSLDVPIDRVRPNPFQARKTMEGIAELADAMRAQGFTTRLRVRPDPTDPGHFQLVFGERRLQAARLAGLTMVPCDVCEHTDTEMIEIGLAENIQRQDLRPLEEAEAFRAMIEQRGYSERQLAERIGKDRGYIQNRLTLLRAPDDVQELVAQRPDTLSAARAIAQLPSPEARRPLIDGLASGRLTHRDVLALVRDPAPQESEVPGMAVPPVTADGPPPQPRTSGARSGTPLGRALERDIPMLHATIARWRLALAKSRPDERAHMQRALRECIEELEELVRALDHGGN